jgi:hypothetical protein
MAAQLKDEGRFPAVQILRQQEFTRFVTACENPKQASAKLKHSVRSGK